MPHDNPLFIQEPRPGAMFIADPMPAASGAAIGLWFPIGSAFEAEGQHGLSHFVEHMVFKGAGDRDAENLSRTIDREGGFLNAFTERETVCLHCTIPAVKASLATSVLLDMAFRPRFTKAEFELEKDVIVNEIMSAEDDLEEAGQDEFFGMTYAGHPVGRRIAGTVDDVRSAEFDALVAFHHERFCSGPIVMTASGAVDAVALADAFAAVVGRSGNVKPAGDPGHATFVPSRRMVPATGSQVYVFTGLPLERPFGKDEFWLMTMINSAYGESMSSRLFMRLRERAGLCYSIGSSFNFSVISGIWGIASATSPSQFPRFAEAYKRESEALHTDGLMPEEVDEAASRIRGLLRLASDDPEYRMKRLARQYLFEGKVETVGDVLRRLDQPAYSDVGSINALIHTRLDPTKENILLYGKLTRRVQAAGEKILGVWPDR